MTKMLPLLAAAALVAACGEDVPGDTYAPGMSETADGLKVALWSDPGPPRVGTNTLTLEITDAASGAPITGARVEVEPSMPQHGHGSDGVPEVSELGEGRYLVENVVLQMLGNWQIDVRVNTGGGDRLVRFHVEVE